MKNLPRTQTRLRLGAGCCVPVPSLAALLLAGLTVAGCSPVNRDELTKEVLKADPSFSTVLDKHRDLANRIDTFKRELAVKRSTVEQTITLLRKDLETSVQTVKAKTQETKKRIEPDRQRLELALSMAGEELRAKQVQRASLGRSMSQLRKAMKSGSATWTADERARQDKQMQEMGRDAARLDGEMTALRQHVRLLKIKLLLIKL